MVKTIQSKYAYLMFMKIRSILIAALFLITGSSVCCAQDEDITEDKVAFKTVHIFNLKPEFTVNDLQKILDKFNRLFITLGHPESQYRLWVISKEKDNQAQYLWESNWSSLQVYEKIHKDDEYRKLLRQEFISLRKMFKDHSYHQYHELPITETVPESL